MISLNYICISESILKAKNSEIQQELKIKH